METKIFKSINLIRCVSGASLNLFRYAAKSCDSQGVVTATSYGASDEHPMSIRSASDGSTRNTRGNLIGVWKYAAMLLCLLTLGIGNAWAGGGSSTTYYSKVSVSANPTGAGTVYVKAGNAFSGTKTSDTQDVEDNKSHTYSIKATHATGYAFKSWSGSGVTINGTTNPSTTCTITASSTDKNNRTSGTATATFVKVFQFKAKADFATGSAGLGDVCVNFTNGTPAYQASAMTATTTQNGDDATTASKTKTAYFYAQKHTGAEFRGWYSDAAGTNKVSDNASYSANITSSVIAEPSTPQQTLYAKFEKVETTPSWALAGIAGTEKTLEIGETIELVTETAGNTYSWGTPSYVDTGETNPVMTYDSSKKKFTANRAGTVTVTFTQAAGEDANGVLWLAGEQTFTFTVEKRTPQFAWADPLPNFVVGTSLPVSDLFSFTPAESAQSWTLTSSDPTNLPSIAAPATGLSLPNEVNGVTLTFHQDATWKWNEIENTSIKINVTKEPVVFNWKNPALIAGNTYSWTDFVETNSTGAWNLVSENESVIPTMRSIANTSGTVAAGTVTLKFTQGPDLGHDAVPVQTKTFTVYPADGLATFKVGSTTYNTLTEANNVAKSGNNKVIIVARDGVLPPGDYTISSGVTLLVPYSSSNTGNLTTPPGVTTAATLQPYRTLTLVDGANITVSGNVCVGGQIMSGGGGNSSSYTTGDYGLIDMSRGGYISFENGAKMYCWGYVRGQGYLDGNNTKGVGTIEAKSGSQIWEDLFVGDFRGGTAMSTLISNKSSWHFFPIQSYSMQNIEVPVTYHYGSIGKVYANVYVRGQQTTSGTVIGTSSSLFTLNDGQSTVRKWYDATTDLVNYELNGTATLASLEVSVYLTVNSKDYYLPINSSMQINVNCDMSLDNPVMLHPGAVIKVMPGRTLTLKSKLFVFDHDDWGPYSFDKYFRTVPTPTPHKDRGNGSTNTLDDAKIIVDGKLIVASNGSLYTTDGYADIMSHGGGVLQYQGNIPSNTTMVVCTGAAVNENKSVSAAKLHNDTETEHDTYTASLNTTTFDNLYGRWFTHAAATTPNSNHTYNFTYIDGVNTGATAFCVYASDKTGLMAGYKWVNVELDNSFCGSKTYRGEDGHYYYYNSASTDAVSKWVQLVKLNDALYSGSDNNLYTFTTNNCSWASVGEIDENCMYTIDEVKKALVGTEFVELEKDEYDEVYVKVTDHSDYYMLFDGCVWQHATKILDTYRAYEVLGDPYIWLNDQWTKVAEEGSYYYTTDDQNIKHYYEFDNVTFSWVPVKEKVRISTSTERKDFLTWDDAMLYLGQYVNPTVTLLDDAIATKAVATLAPGSKSTEFTIDLNGYTLTANIGSSAYFMNMNTTAKLYITDNSDKGNGQMLIYSAGNKKIEGIIVTKGKIVMNGGRIYLENGAVYASNTSCQAWTISLRAGQSMEMHGGEVEAKGHRNAVGLYLASSAATASTSKITIDGNASVKATAPNYAYGVYTYGTVNVNGGTIEAKTETVTSAGGSTAGATNAYGIYANVSSNATASSCYYATVNVTGGVINATAATSTAHGISANAGQTIASSVSNYNPATNKASAKLNITGGTINAKCLTSTTAYGVYAFGTENSNGSNASGAHIIKNCKITASAIGTAYGVIMSASLHDLSGIALIGEAEIENVDIYAETTSSSTAAAVYATATSNFMSRAKYNNGTAGVSAANKKLWFIDANNNDGDLTHEAIAVSGTDAKKTYRCKIGATGAGGHITIKSGTFKAKSAYQYAYGAYAARSICNYDGTKGNGEITIIDGTFSAETAAEYAWCLRNDGLMNVQGGTFNALAGTSTAYGVYSDAGVTTIDGGTFNIDATTTTAYGVCATGIIEGNTGWKHRGEIIINDGTFNAHALGTTTAAGVYATGVYAELYQTKYDARKADDKKYYYPVDEEGNKVADATTANYYPYRFGVHTIGGKVTVNGGTFNAKAFTTTAMGAYAYWSPAVRTDMIGWQGVARGEIFIHDGEFNSETETSTTAEGVRSYGTVYVDGGTFNIKSKTSTAYGVRVLDGTTTVDGGTFNVKAGTETSIGVRTEFSYSTTYGYCGVGEAIINGGTFNVNTWAGSTAYGVNVTGTTGAFSATSATGYTGEKPKDYAYASSATINGGTFITNPSNGTSSYGIVVEATKTRGSETAYPKCEVNGGFFLMKGNSNSVYACGTSATEDADGNPNLAIKGGHFSTNVNLSQSGTKNPVRTPYNIIACVHSEYKATYPHEVTEAYTITFKDDEDNILWSGLQPKGSTAVYPLTNGTPEKTPTSTNSFEFASWDKALAEVTADATYTASFTAVAKKFMVTWKDDKGNEIDHMEYASGQTPTHADPVKEGYTFTGWDPEMTAVVAADQTYTATFSINQYTIRWENEDGSLIREDKVNHGTTPTKPADPTKEGYSFQAWNPGVVKATEDVTYTATYLLNLVTLTKANSTTATPYVTFAAALTEANKADGGTLTLLQDVKVAGSSQSFTKTMTLDLNGHTLRGAVNKLINVNGTGKTLTIRDSQGGGKIDNTLATNAQLAAVYVTAGTFVLESGKIYVENPTTASHANYYAAAVFVPSGKTFTMNGGTLESVVNVDYAYGVFNQGTTTINKGTINTSAPSRSYGIRADNTTTIEDVTIHANATRTTYGVAVWSSVADKTITINGGTFNGIATTTTGYAIDATAASTINVNGGKFKSTTKTVSNTGSATIKLNAGFYDKDTELAGLASPKQVVALTTEPEKAEGYNYKVVDNAHQITFKNEDGSVILQQSNIEDGVQPVYHGEAQTKSSTPKYSYSFDGWKDASDDHVYAENELPVVSKDAVYTAHFAQSGVTYPITFANIDGMGTDYVQMVAYDEVPVYNGATPYMSGAVSNYAYTFIGWDPELTAVTGATTYTPRFDLVISHNVSFVINNGSAANPAALTVAEGAAVERPADQLIGCQHIAGWYQDAGLNEEWDFANDKMGDHDLVLYAKWETKTYTITWLDENADEIDQTIVDCGTIPTHANLYKSSTAAYSYEWKGWNKTLVAANGNATYKSLGFTQVPKRYAITFVTGSGATVINPIEQEVGSDIVAPADPTREGYTFNGWIPTVPMVMPANDVECVAQWTVNTHKFAWNFDGGTPSGNYTESNNSLAYGSAITYPTLSKTGYTFAGWSSNATSMPDADLTITASWTVNTHKFAWNFDGGTPSGNYTAANNALAYGSAITYPTLSKTGYTFAGWSTSATSMPDADLTITASWTVNTHKFAWNFDGGTPSGTYTEANNSLAYGSAITYPTLSKTGYTFAGWSSNATSMPDADLTITASWTVNTHKFAWNFDGGTPSGTYTESNNTLAYGSAITYPTLSKTGYTFAGWSSNATSMPDADLTITASWTVNTHKFAWNFDGGTPSGAYTEANNALAYGSAITYPTLSKTGYTFVGWSSDATSMPDADLTITASWTVNTHKLAWDFDGGTPSGSYTEANNALAYGSTITYPTLSKMGYTFAGWSSSATSMPDADLTITASWTPNTNTAYSVEHYWQNINDDNYTKHETVNMTGTTDATTEAVAESYTGFEAQSFSQGTVAPNGSTVVKIYYNRKTYLIKWDVKLNGEQEAYKEETLRYGAMPSYGADPTKEQSVSQVYSFSGWSPTPYAVDKDQTYNGSFKVAARPYTITFVNDNGVELWHSDFGYGLTPSYGGSTPVSTHTGDGYAYTFAGWKPAIAVVSGEATYMAKYNRSAEAITVSTPETVTDNTIASTTTVENGGALTIEEAELQSTTIIVETGGQLNVEESGSIEADVFIIQATTEEQGEPEALEEVQVSGELSETGSKNVTAIYYDLTRKHGTENFLARVWYAVAVPWAVEVPTYSNGGVFIKRGENYIPQRLGATFDLLSYDGDCRAQNGASANCWVYLEDEIDGGADPVMVPGKLYMIYLTEETSTIRFKKKDGEAIHTNTLAVSAHETENGNDANWNGIANPATYRAHMNVNVGDGGLVQKFVPGTQPRDGGRYLPLDLDDRQAVGQPFFVQVDPTAGTSVVVTRTNPSAAPRRAKAEQDQEARYAIGLAANGKLADRLYIQTAEEKEDRYVIGKDMSKMGVSSYVAQMWVERYNSKLCLNTMTLTRDIANYPLGISAPQAGEYKIFAPADITTGDNIYLTFNGRVIWNLTMAPYYASLEKGTTTSYGLRIVHFNTPAVTTGVDDVRSENTRCMKVVMDDHVYILRGEELYTVTGQKAK